MNTETFITEAKLRFNHNAAKEYLKEKYDAKLLLAEQGGLWRANIETISFLASNKYTPLIMVDTFGNPVKVDREELLDKLSKLYHDVMNDWYNEYKELENKR